MNLGLGNLIELKQRLLSPEHVSESTWDEIIADLGRGVAARFDKETNRTLAYAAAQVDEFNADRAHWILNAYPVVSITSLEIRDDYAAAWASQTLSDYIAAIDEAKGLINFGAILGSRIARARITYAGGYWFDTEEDFSGSQPADTTARPNDLKYAWLTQCAHTWRKMDVLGATMISDEEHKPTLTNLALIPEVKECLADYRRFAIGT